MGCEDEVMKIAKRLDKMASGSSDDQTQALDLLKNLQELPITLEILQRTRIGMTVNSLRKSSNDEEVITLAKVLIKSWKKLLSGTPSSKEAPAKEPEPKPSASAKQTAAAAGRPNAKQTSFPADTTNAVRLKCRELLSSALKCEDMPEGCNTDSLAAKIEENILCLLALSYIRIYNEFGDTNNKYKNRVRSRVSNLKDSKNPALRLNVLHGAIEPERIARMTAEYVDSDADEELLFNIPFTGNVKLKSILVVGGDAGMHPSKIRMFKNRPQMTFDDARATPEQEFELQPDASGNLEYPVRAVKFSSVHHLSLHFPSNFGSETTRVYYIGLHGEYTEAQRQGVVLCSYESAANPADHKVQQQQRANMMIQ
ncbi:hypothetical protein HPB50_015271 [Hyalomma asiaticum]|uniref:Uncharacterized protein n=1 Tax=Hyalomma asiaticum TaxID=266040 RepID=A0ACB7RL02_HYAAI|nr:hypothetical protein HPB50_015271 [Hyalomma asiaticum]